MRFIALECVYTTHHLISGWSNNKQKRELGAHAFEERMPTKVATIVENESDLNSLAGVVPKLSNLLHRDSKVEMAYLCIPTAIQVYKLHDEGNHFCGYRNLQMLCLALGKSPYRSRHCLRQKLPIPKLQEMIEEAWEKGINAHGKVQTGGIKGTRKHIGTSESRQLIPITASMRSAAGGVLASSADSQQAEAILLSLDIACTGTAFSGKDAWRELLDYVEQYFAEAQRFPIYLQRPNHSLTIVGVERFRNGKRGLLVFDPAWWPPMGMCKLHPEGTSEKLGWSAKWTLSQYRKSERYLKRFSAFETLVVDDSA